VSLYGESRIACSTVGSKRRIIGYPIRTAGWRGGVRPHITHDLGSRNVRLSSRVAMSADTGRASLALREADWISLSDET
jgi:hypothetical protein